MIQQRLAALPPSVKHIVVVAPVPVLYPQLQIIDASLKHMMGQGRSHRAIVSLMQKTGLSSHIHNHFGLPDVLGDRADHWSAKAHAEEKLTMLHMLQVGSASFLSCSRLTLNLFPALDPPQNMSQRRGFRFSFLSGDVHLAAVGRFCTRPVTNLRTDPRYMPQVRGAEGGGRRDGRWLTGSLYPTAGDLFRHRQRSTAASCDQGSDRQRKDAIG